MHTSSKGGRRQLFVKQEGAKELPCLSRRKRRNLVASAPEGDEGEPLIVHDLPSADLSKHLIKYLIIMQKIVKFKHRKLIKLLDHLLAMVPRRPLLHRFKAKLSERVPRGCHRNSAIGVAAENPNPDASVDELANDRKNGCRSILPF